jgi:hypothetical protein
MDLFLRQIKDLRRIDEVVCNDMGIAAIDFRPANLREKASRKASAAELN